MSITRRFIQTTLPVALLVVLGSIHTFVLEPKTADAAVPTNGRKILSSSYYSQPYYQSTYYSQGAYTTLSKSSTVTGQLSVLGALSKGSGTFVIDHPLDPKNKLLYHSFVESPDVKNIYDGIATLDAKGEAVIQLPSYFTALNTNMRYLASAVNTPMPDLHLKRVVHRPLFSINPRPQFTIAGGVPGGSISWQVSGIRKDPLIIAHPIITEVDKGESTLMKKGECIFEPLCK